MIRATIYFYNDHNIAFYNIDRTLHTCTLIARKHMFYQSIINGNVTQCMGGVQLGLKSYE